MPARSPRRTASGRARTWLRAGVALLASAAANGLALAALEAAGAFRLPSGDRPAVVALAPLGGERWEANRTVGDAPAASAVEPAPVPPPPEPPRPAERPDGRVVRVAPSPDSRRPARARFLAERDNTVERETQWRGTPSPGEALAARPTVGAPGAHGVALPGEAGTSEDSRPGREGSPAGAAESRIARARLALAPEPGGTVPEGASGAEAAARAGEAGARRAGAFDPRVLPVGTGFAAAGGGAPSGERLPGVAPGDATLVNTRAFRYAAFYQRVREAITGEWDPNRAWDAQDPHDRVLGRSTRRVLVDIVLDPEGRLREARLVRGSGLAFFDRECLRAISAAAPFPNPPRGLVGPDGLVLLSGWGLVFEWGPEALLDRLLPNR